MTKVIFDVNCLGYSVGDKDDIDDALAETLIKAGAAHELTSNSIAYGDIVNAGRKQADRAEKASRAKVTKPAEPMVTKGD